MVKRIILISVALFCVLLCVFCISKANNITLTVKKSPWGEDAFQLQEKAINKFISEFNEKHPEIRVNVNFVQEYPADLKDSEIVLLGADEMLEYASDDLKNLSGLVSEVDFSESIIDVGKLSIDSSKKDLFFVPFNYDRAVVYADKGLFDHLGVEVPASNWTYDDFKETITKVTKRGCDYDGYVHSVGIHLPMARPYVWRYFYENLGDGWYNPSDNYVKFNSDKNIKVLEELLGFYKKNAKCYSISVPDTGIYDSITAMTWINACQPEYDDFRLISDKLSYSLLGRRIDSVAEKGNLVLLPLPSVNGKNMSYSNTEFIKGFAVSKYINENKLDAAVKLIEFSQTLAGNSTLHEYYAGIPASKSLWKESYWKKGLFSGQNAESVLVGIENDTRNDFAEILSGDDAVYEKNIRFRAICSNLMLEEVKRGSKSIKAITEIMNTMAGFFNSTMTVYGVPNGYNPNLVARGHK